MSMELNDRNRLQRIDFQRKIVESGIWQSCLNCSNFESESEVCKIYNQKPPAYIVINGCEKHIGDIPF